MSFCCVWLILSGIVINTLGKRELIAVFIYLFIYLFNTCAVCRILFALSFGVIGGQDYASRYVY